MGIFHAFVEDRSRSTRGGRGRRETGLIAGEHSASLQRGISGVLHGSLSYLLQDENGQVHPAHSISAGLDYPGVGPEHSHLKDTGRALYVSITDAEAVEGLRILSRLEGIIPALETSHAVALGRPRQRDHLRKPNDAVLICISGPGATSRR